MTFGLAPGKLGFKLGEVLVGLQSGTQDTPETISSTQNKLHVLGWAWNPDTLAYVSLTSGGEGTGLEVTVTNPSLTVSSTGDEALRLDEASASVSYVGTAATGSGEGSAVWKIKKITISGTVTSITWADGNGNYDNVWSNRASLSYS